jgi:hypothetical protein
MKIQLDTTAKTIKVEGSVNLNELYEALKKLLPQGEWKDFILEANTSITWINPITIQPYIYPYNPYPWWGSPVVYCGGTSQGNLMGNTLTAAGEPSYVLNQGIYNIQI